MKLNPIVPFKEVAENARKVLKQYLIDNKLQSLVIGVSGGIDSAVCLALAKPVCQELGIELIGRSITIQTNKADEIHRANVLGKEYCTNFEDVNLTSLFEAMISLGISETLKTSDTAQLTHKEKVRQGNIKARTRMIYLYDIASDKNGMVLSTDNYTELLCGFWTLHGDVGDYGMIQNLWKTEVYGLAKYLATETENPEPMQLAIDATPTDGLGISSSDLEQLGCNSYSEVDSILKDMVEGRVDTTAIPVQKFHQTEYKRNNPYNIPREILCPLKTQQ